MGYQLCELRIMRKRSSLEEVGRRDLLILGENRTRRTALFLVTITGGENPGGNEGRPRGL